MKAYLWAMPILMLPALGWAAGSSVTVNQSGTGNYTNIQAAIDSGASVITITDSGHYVEDLQIGDPSTGGPPVTLTSNQAGTNRPVITPLAGHIYEDTRRNSQSAGFGLLADNSAVSNLVLEASGSLGTGAMMIMATNVVIENCLFRIAAGEMATLGSFSPLLFFAQQDSGGGGSGVPMPGGPDCNGCVVRNCEFMGIAPDSDPIESTPDSAGYLDERSSGKGTGQGSGYARCDHYSDGRDVYLTFEGCYFHHCRDYGIFPSNFGSGEGSINLVIRKCRFDAQGKFQIRGRGANVFVEDSVFTRSGQSHNGDGENSAVAINNQDGHSPSATVKNSLFVNCGSGNWQQGYFGGVNNHNGTQVGVDHCTFVSCLNGVGAGSGGAGILCVSNSIFHQIGDSTPPGVDSYGVTLTNGSPELVAGLDPAWTNGLVNFGGNKWAAVFNRYNWNNAAQIVIDNCLVGSIDSEDTNTWDEALTNVVGCRLFAGYATNFTGAETVTRSIPIFQNSDPDAPNAFALAANSPGQGLGANLAPVFEPRIACSPSATQLTISWKLPIWVKGTLKATSSLASPAWTSVPGTTTPNGVDYVVSIPIGAGNQFYAVVKE